MRIGILAAMAGLLAAGTPLGAVDIGANSAPRRGVLQCVPYARDVTGIRIFGDAHTWWRQAHGQYARGSRPKVGAVMNFRPHGNSRLGHVAAVSRIVDSRTVLIRHANWSSPGRIENDVRAVDVSAEGDWSQVRVWNGQSQRMGGGVWPLYGFIYRDKPGRSEKPAGRIDPRSITYAQDPIGAIIAGRRR